MNITQEQSKMTIFYNKRLGTIQAIAGGIQDMSYFGEEEEDFKLIYDYIVVDNDEYVINNSNNFCVSERQLKFKNAENVNKYL